MKSGKGFKIGLIVSAILILLILGGSLTIGLRSYDGIFIPFEPPQQIYTFLEFVPPYLLLLIVYSIFGKLVLALLVFLIILSPSVIGYLAGEGKSGIEDANQTGFDDLPPLHPTRRFQCR